MELLELNLEQIPLHFSKSSNLDDLQSTDFLPSNLELLSLSATYVFAATLTQMMLDIWE